MIARLQVLGRWILRLPGRLWAGFGQAVSDSKASEVTAAFLVGAFSLVAGALAIIGLGEGDIDRGVVTYPGRTTFAFALIVAAVCLGSAMSLLAGRARWRGLAGIAGLIVLGGGLVLLATAAIDGRLAKDRPQVSAKIERTPLGLRVKGSVSASGLTSREHILVRVVGISTRNRLAEAHVGHLRGKEAPAPCDLADLGMEAKPDADDGRFSAASTSAGTKPKKPGPRVCWRQLAYSSRTGAGADGKVEVALDAPIASGVYERVDVEAVLDENEPVSTTATTAGAKAKEVAANTRELIKPRCDKNGGNFACVTLMIPPTARRPELDARWKLPASSPPVLVVNARMGDLSIDDRVQLSVRRVRGMERRGRIYAASWAPSAAGEVNQKLELPVAPNRQKLCVVMRVLRSSVRVFREDRERYGPCRVRSQGMAVQLYGPPRRAPSP